MQKLVIATNNPGKQKEIISLLSKNKIDLLTPVDLGIDLIIEEDGTTYRENAAKKAISFAKASGLVSLADDSGLEVEILRGAPGLFSARYTTEPKATDKDRRIYLLEQLKSHPQPWKARFCCVVAISTPKGHLQYFSGTCNGIIIPNERGIYGFGYDPIFYIPAIGKTMAELSLEEKNRISHRAIAVKRAIPTLISIFTNKIA